MPATTYKYVSPGVIDVTDANGKTTQLKFTTTGQIQSIQDPLNRVTNFTYDTNDHLNQITAPGNVIYKYSYDSQGRLLSQVDPLNQTVSFAYGANSDSLTKVTDPKGQAIQYGYNNYGELTSITYADGKSETFTYDKFGNLTQAKERSNDTFQYTYDSTGRVTRKTFDDGTFEQYAYDSKGNLTSVRDVSGGTQTLVYDANNRLTKITYPGGRFLEYTYDAQGQRTQMKDQSGFTTNYSYDLDSRLTKLTNASGGTIISYTYDALGRLSKETNGNSTYTTYSYDDAGQVTNITNYTPTGTVNSSFQYTYDNLGRQTGATTRDGTWAYTYDTTGQLTRGQFTSTNSSIANQDLQYVYDAAGNRIRTIVNGVTTNYTANNLNQYTTVGGATYTYDADGNLTKVVNGTSTWTYTYNDENQLIGGTTPTATFSYEYDAFGNRKAAVFNGQRTEYLVDPFGFGDVVGEYGGGATTNYVHGIGLVGRFTGANAAYYDSDLLGSTAGLTNAAGSYVNRYAYRPFGENLLTTEGVANPFEFVGQWGVMDEANGLDFMRARFYDNKLGRFTALDPIGLNGGDTNLYRYVANNPVSLVDPSGLKYINRNNNPSSELASTLQNLGNTFNTNNISKGLGYASGLAGALAIGISLLSGGTIPLGLITFASVTGFGSAFLSNDPNSELAKYLFGQSISGLSSISGFFKGVNISWKLIKQLISPLVLDLDNDGIELISLENSTAFFDLDADGFAENTGWVKSDDGILALDLNNNGRIDNINEVFGNATTDGFIILKQLDSNNDLIIDSRDAQFANLKVWKDKDEDGFTDVGELRSLLDWGIRSINLEYQSVNQVNEGNHVSSISNYILSDGTTRQIVDVWFILDQMNSRYNGEFKLKEEILYLPSLRGYGEIPNLFIAISQDQTLLGMMRNLVLLNTNNFEQFHAQFITQVEALLYRWAGVENVATNSRGSNVDARKLTFLEKFFGEDFLQNGSNPNPGSQAGNAITGLWNDLFRELVGRLLVQGQMHNLFPNSTFSHNTDTLETSTSLDTILSGLVTNAPTSTNQAILYWNFAVAALDIFESRFNLSPEDFDVRISQVLANAGFSGFLNTLRQADFLQAFATVIFGTSGNDTLNGGTGNDQINGAAGNDLISGGAGNDILDGGIGNDTVNGGDGNDTIKAGFGTDTVDGGNGQDTLELNLSGQTTNLTITNPLNSGSLPGIASATNFEFIKLTTGSGNDTITQASIINGNVFRSNDVFNSGAGNDVINAGLGVNDQVNGGSGIDTLILNYSVDDVGNKLQFTLAASNANGISGSAGRTTTTNTWLDSISFSGIERFNITGTRNAENITTWTGDDTINGGAGNDTIDGGGGKDTINAGDGNDTVIVKTLGFTADGGAGTDKLVLNLSAQTTDINITVTPSGITTPGVTNTISNFESILLTNTGSGNDIVNTTAVSSNYWIRSGAGNDTVNTGAGKDRIEGGDGDDILRGGAGDDTGNQTYLTADNNAYEPAGLFGGAGNDQLFGEAGNDALFGGDGNDTLNGGDGDDFFDGAIGINQIIGGLGIDHLRLNLATATTTVNVTYTSTATGTVSDGNSFREIERLNLDTGNGNDTLNVTALTGNSWIRSGIGNDTVNAGAGRDRLEGGDGNDTLRGGAGDDTSNQSYSTPDSYAYEPAGLFGGAGNDQLFGEAGNDALFGGDGNDTLNGGDGDDFLDGGIGINQSIGGLGIDQLRLNFATATTAVNVTYTTTATGTVSDGNSFREIERLNLDTGNGNDTLNVTALTGNSWIRSGIGNDTVNAGSGKDRLEGGDGDDILRGGAGNDTDNQSYSTPDSYAYEPAGLFGGAGNDQLFGEAGNDALFGGDGNDTLNGGDGDDFLDGGIGINQSIGGLGIDQLRLNFATGTTAVNVTYTSTATGTVSDGNSFREIERLNLDTGNGNDTLNVTALTGNSWIRSGIGNDTVNAGSGKDRLEGGDGDDILRGGAGNDTDNQSYSTPDSYAYEPAGLFGGAGNDQLFGEAGNDALFGGDGNDTLNGGDGDDFLDGGIGINQSIGGLGVDQLRLNFATATTAINVTYTSTTTGTVSDGSSFLEIERLNLDTGSGNDTLNVTALTGNSWIRSGAGNDTVNAGAGRDRIEGGDGNDTLRGGAGDDTGNQSYSTPDSYAYEPAGLFGGAGNDQLFGEAGNDALFGGDGNDTLNGGDGDDFLDGGTGINQSIGGIGIDQLRLNLSSATTGINVTYTSTTTGTVSGGSTFREIERLNLDTGNGSDTLNVTALTGNSWIRSGAGNDTVNAGAGRDRIEGGDGDDILRGGAGDDTSNQFYSTPDSSAYEKAGLFGGAGNDQLFGEAGNDDLFGGDGNDILNGGIGADRFIFDSGVAFSATSLGIDNIIDFASGTDKIVIDKTTFTAVISAAGSALNASEFAVINVASNGISIAGNSTAAIVFNQANGDLFYNSNGSTAGLGTGGLFANLSGVTSLSATDFAIQA
jgi:RHS repeat-associated protein